MSNLEQIIQRINSLQKDLAAAKADYDAGRLALLKEVDVVRNDASITLRFKGRVINAKKNRYGRYKVTENKKTLSSEYGGGIHDLRFSIACGLI